MWTRGDFINYATTYDVTVETLPNVQVFEGAAQLHYLERTGGVGTLTHELPRNWSPDRPIGPIRLARACRDLDIPRPDWPLAEWIGSQR